MKRILFLIFISFSLQSCMTYYRTSSNLSNLRVGMSKEEVKNSYNYGEKKNGRIVKGSVPNEIGVVQYKNGWAERWVFNVYDCDRVNPFASPFSNECLVVYHDELYFKDDILVEFNHWQHF